MDVGAAEQLGLMGQQVIESDAFEGGADVLVGVSEQQVAALTDLLMHFDEFVKQKFTLEAYLPAPAPAAEKAAADGGEKNDKVTKIDAEAVADPADRKVPAALPEKQAATVQRASGRLAAMKPLPLQQKN